MIGPLAALVLAALAARSPDQRQTVADLAYVLGEAHALRQACAGAGDQAWRTQMSRLLAFEGTDEAFKRRLTDSFNAGYMTQQAEHPACGPAVDAALREVSARGRALAERLGGEGS